MINSLEKLIVNNAFQAEAISSLEKENLKLIEAITELEEELRTDKQKIKTLESSASHERDNVLEQLNSTVAQVEAQRKKYLDLQTMLKEARDDIIKLEEENTRLKDQVRLFHFFMKAFVISFVLPLRLCLNGQMQQNQILIVCFR